MAPDFHVCVVDCDPQGEAAQRILSHDVVQAPYHLFLVLMQWRSLG